MYTCMTLRAALPFHQRPSTIRTTVTLVLALFLACAGAGCGPSTMSDKGASKSASKAVSIKGSDTMVHLVTNWSEAFMKDHPEAELSVTGGGSGTGIAALLNGSTDICAASREMSAEEKAQAAQRGIHPKEIEVGRDAIAVVVHPSNPLNELTLEQLAKIFTGATTQWKDLGGADTPILVLSRESSSGTYVFFQEHVLKKKDYTPQARLMPATSAIIQAASADAGAIGYVGLGYAAEAGSKVKVLHIKADANSAAIAPSEASVRDKTYSIARALYFYVNDPPDPRCDAFIQFCLGGAGQQIVRDAGYIPVK